MEPANPLFTGVRLGRRGGDVSANGIRAVYRYGSKQEYLLKRLIEYNVESGDRLRRGAGIRGAGYGDLRAAAGQKKYLNLWKRAPGFTRIGNMKYIKRDVFYPRVRVLIKVQFLFAVILILGFTYPCFFAIQHTGMVIARNGAPFHIYL